MSKWLKHEVGVLTANDLSMTSDMYMKYLWNRTYMVHENIFWCSSLRQIICIFAVKFAPICDSTVISSSQVHGFMQRAGKGTWKKECESKKLWNSETHGGAIYNESGSRIAMCLQKECGAWRSGRIFLEDLVDRREERRDEKTRGLRSSWKPINEGRSSIPACFLLGKPARRLVFGFDKQGGEQVWIFKNSCFCIATR